MTNQWRDRNSLEIHRGDETLTDRGSHVTINKTDSGKWIAGLFLMVVVVVALAWGVHALKFIWDGQHFEGSNIDTTTEGRP